MGLEQKITCDECSKDITSTGNCEDWRISVKNEAIPSCSGMVTLMAIARPLKQNLYFCGLKCLKLYVTK